MFKKERKLHESCKLTSPCAPDIAGMKEIKIINEEVVGNVHIMENSQFNCIRSPMVILAENITARLFGQIKDILINEGSTVYIHGSVTGKIENRGGDIQIFNHSNQD
ncbi:MAG: hypothetical protein K0R26_2452 [Bacteroidota bacterium]|jgi:hypothetical protein|nr:hypothetical protein [Bacteroidota bacterium]